MTLALRYAVRSDVGLLREGNEDSAYAGPRLLAIADGMGGYAAGEVASAAAITTISALDEDLPPNDLIDALAEAVVRANRTLHEMVNADPSIRGMGTTLTAMLWSGARVAVCHIGDSRAYVLSHGELKQITRDHTFVQSLVDEGHITPDEAATHPQRSLLMRALDGTSEAEPDLALRDVSVGDRYLLCSDGLSSVVSEDTLRQTLASIPEPSDVVLALVELAIRGGGPDNITCIVADVVDSESARTPPTTRSVLAGAASNGAGRPPMRTNTPAGRAHVLSRTAPQPAITLDHDDEAPSKVDADPDGHAHPRRRVPVVTSLVVILAIVVVGGGYAGWRYTQDQYFVGSSSGQVVIFRGVNQSVAGVHLSHVYTRTGIPLAQVPMTDRPGVQQTIPTSTLKQAQQITSKIRTDYQACLTAESNLSAYNASYASWQHAMSAYEAAHHTKKPVTVKGKHYTPPKPPAGPPTIPNLGCTTSPAGAGSNTQPASNPSASPSATPSTTPSPSGSSGQRKRGRS